MQTVPIKRAKNSKKGTQLKLVFEVEGNQEFIFKPAWYKRNRLIEGPVYSGKDRHNSEIMGFYLGAILNLRWTPMVVGRMVNLKQIYEGKFDILNRRKFEFSSQFQLLIRICERQCIREVRKFLVKLI